MREIKFRAWDGRNMRHSFLLTSEHGIFDLDEDDAPCELSPFDCPAHEFFYHEHPDWPLMQFTGLKDKNCVEIYEGDILGRGDKGEVLPVSWSETEVGFRLPDEYSITYKGWEIIGNIYENPDLLK